MSKDKYNEEVIRLFTLLKKPYDNRQFDELSPENQVAVRAAEGGAFAVICNAVAYNNPAIQKKLHAQDIFLEDGSLIDKPLEFLNKLKEAYEASGLAALVNEDAKTMANNFKNSVVKQAEQKLQKRKRS